MTVNLSFFFPVIPVLNTQIAYFLGAENQMFLDVDVPIVDTIIRKMLFDPDTNSETVESSLNMFEPTQRAGVDRNAVTHYLVHMKKLKLFKRLLGLTALGCSFRLAFRQIALIREVLSLGYFNGNNDAKVSHYIQVAAAVCLQKISELLKRI